MMIINQLCLRASLVVLATIFSLGLGGQDAIAKKSQGGSPPDYTKGEKPADQGTMWALGATGAFGFIHNPDAVQIYIQEVAGGSPADGKLKEGDVILGIHDGKNDAFSHNCRQVLAEAIDQAESTAGKGRLALNIWREGKTIPVELTLPVLGSFSSTAPWGCPKTDALIDQAAKSIVDRMNAEKKRSGNFNQSIWTHLDVLGLLATGEAQYRPLIQDYAREIAEGEEDGEGGLNVWQGAYKNVLLTEYYLAANDKSVLPGITRLATRLARGVSGVGTWSHGTADVEKNGMYGPPGAYGAMNQASMVCALSLVLAQKCGVQEPLVDEAVSRALAFLDFYIDKGIIPYGDHPPKIQHDNNGRMSIGAVLYDLAGNKEAATFCTRMTLASYNRREVGHTGHFFAWQWGALGAARGGPLAAQSFIKNTRWFTELERRADGSSWYQSQLNFPGKYKNWSTTGQRLMQHCLPRKALCITGKGGSCIKPFTLAEVEDAVEAAPFAEKGDESEALVGAMSVKELMERLHSWSMVERFAAARELGERDENVVDQLIAMLDSENRYARYGACTGLRFAGRQSDKAVDALIHKMEHDPDMTLRYFAIDALTLPRGQSGNGLGEASRKATTALLKLAAVDDHKQDATRKLTRQIADMMFYGGRVSPHIGYFPDGKGVENLDRAVLLPAVKDMLVNPNGGTRSAASSIYPHLKPEDLEALWPQIYRAASEAAPSGVMFAGAARANSMKIMAEYKFKEGLPLAHEYLVMDGWGKFGRVPAAYAALSQYGSAAKEYLPDIEKEWQAYQSRKSGEVERCKKQYDALMDALEKDVELRSIKPYLEKETK
jgi:hypothetical protein